MKLQTKKVIAREFLILIMVITIGLFSFLCTYPYNWIKYNQAKEADKKIVSQTHLADSLSKSFDDKTIDGKDYISRVYIALKENSVDFSILNFNYSEPDFRQKILYDRNFRDYIYQAFQNKLVGFTKTQAQFDSSVNSQITSTDIDNKKQSKLIFENIQAIKNEEGKYLSSILTFNESVSFGVRVLILTALVFFVLRFLFYAIKWSIKTMKQKQN